jgi:hypothetical protein
MDNKAFDELKMRMAIVPQQTRWPAPDSMPWQRLHAVPNEARERVSKACAQMDEIDRNPDLSREGKQLQRNEAAAKALAGFELSKTLALARDAVRYDASSAVCRAVEQAEAGWERAMDKISERAGRAIGPDRQQR